MKLNEVIALLFISALSSSVIAAPQAHAQPHPIDNLLPDVPYQRKTQRTHVFSRAQFIYSPGSNDYLHHWVDRPLHIDPTLDAGMDPAALMSLQSYRKMQEKALSYGLDGLAFFPNSARRMPFYDYTRQSNLPGFQLLSELVVNDQGTTKDQTLEQALATPSSFRIDGKVVFTSSHEGRYTPEYWEQELARLKAKFGNTFLFLPDIVYPDGKSLWDWRDKYHNNTVTAEEIARIKDYLRRWARVTDGLYTAYAAGYIGNARKVDDDFYRNFIIRLFKSVLAEPEFKDKYLALSAAIGHENATRFGYTLSSDGTKTLRRTLEAAISANPDIINIPEWDEQNEYTSLRPTVYNGTSSQRLLRYYTAGLKNIPLTPIIGDDTETPNLIISIRKVLVLGEKLEVELLNIPDTAEDTSYTVRFTLEDETGATVYTAPPQTFSRSRLIDHTLSIPSETLADHTVLRPRLQIEANGRSMEYRDGLQYIELRPTWNWDYKWVKQPLRDLLKPQDVTFTVSPTNADGTRMVNAAFQAGEPLDYVEVLDNNDVVYSYVPGKQWRENSQQVIIRLSWQAFGGVSTGLELQGSVALQNSTGRWQYVSSPLSPVLRGQTLSFDGKRASMWRSSALVTIPRTELEHAALRFDLPGIYQGTVAIRDIVTKTVYGIPGPKGFNMVISRYLSQDKLPLNLNGTLAQFTMPVLPETPRSIFHLHAIAKSGRQYRSKPLFFKTPETAKRAIVVYSDTAQKPVTLQLNAGQVPDIQYQWKPSHGSALLADAGRPFWGILGGYFAQVTGRGGGNAGDDSPFIYGYGGRDPLPADSPQTAPDWIKTETGEDALAFNGQSTYISLPQGVIPRRAAFTISMDIKPDDITGKRVIIANRSYYPGSITVYSEDGILKAHFLGEKSSVTGADSGLLLPAGQWSRLVIRYDQQNLLFTVNGKTGKPLPMAGPGMYDTATTVGGYGKEWFQGQIKGLRIQHTM